MNTGRGELYSDDTGGLPEGFPEIEGYGSPDDRQEIYEGNELKDEGQATRHEASPTGYSGGTEGVSEGNNEGFQFGEYGNTNRGTDLTRSMETHPLPPEQSTQGGSNDEGEVEGSESLVDRMGPQDLDPHTGLVKGGEREHEEAGGPARYGGDT